MIVGCDCSFLRPGDWAVHHARRLHPLLGPHQELRPAQVVPLPCQDGCSFPPDVPLHEWHPTLGTYVIVQWPNNRRGWPNLKKRKGIVLRMANKKSSIRWQSASLMLFLRCCGSCVQSCGCIDVCCKWQ